jgi:hypothetical protein
MSSLVEEDSKLPSTSSSSEVEAGPSSEVVEKKNAKHCRERDAK